MSFKIVSTSSATSRSIECSRLRFLHHWKMKSSWAAMISSGSCSQMRTYRVSWSIFSFGPPDPSRDLCVPRTHFPLWGLVRGHPSDRGAECPTGDQRPTRVPLGCTDEDQRGHRPSWLIWVSQPPVLWGAHTYSPWACKRSTSHTSWARGPASLST